MVARNENEGVLFVPFSEPVYHSLVCYWMEVALRYKVYDPGHSLQEILLFISKALVGVFDNSTGPLPDEDLPQRSSNRLRTLRYAEPTPIKKMWGASLQLDQCQ